MATAESGYKRICLPFGLYISVPFCRTKCSYCNFASGVFSREKYARYVEVVCADMARASEIADMVDGKVERAVDTVYLGGGTPTLLEPDQLEGLVAGIRQNFHVAPDPEIPAASAPGPPSPTVADP